MLDKFKDVNKKELSMIEVAHAILKQKNNVMEFNALLVAIQDFLELSENELDNRMSIFYTELNTDGLFISLGDNRWGLRSWYAIDSIDEELASTMDHTETRRKKRKSATPDDYEDVEDIVDVEDDLETDDIEVGLEPYVDVDLNVLTTDDDDDFTSPAIEEELTIVTDDEIFTDI